MTALRLMRNSYGNEIGDIVCSCLLEGKQENMSLKELDFNFDAQEINIFYENTKPFVVILFLYMRTSVI